MVQTLTDANGDPNCTGSSAYFTEGFVPGHLEPDAWQFYAFQVVCPPPPPGECGCGGGWLVVLCRSRWEAASDPETWDHASRGTGLRSREDRVGWWGGAGQKVTEAPASGRPLPSARNTSTD